MKVFLTGADGFLGSNLTRLLLEQGYQVKAFVNPKIKTNTLDGLPIDVHEGDLLNENDVINGSSDCDVIIHTAASTSVWPSRSSFVREINIKGTQNIISAVQKNKIKRLVYVGSASSFGIGTLNKPGNENSPFASSKYKLDYIDSKYEAQKIINKKCKEENLPVITVAPTFMIGAYDIKPGPGAMIINLINGSIPGYSKGGRNFAYVKDVAQGIINAITKGKIGESYILGNQNLSYKEFFDIVSDISGAKKLKLKIPSILIKSIGILGSIQGKLTGKAPKLSLPMTKVSCDTHYFSPEKAIKELDLPQTPISIAIEDAISWFKKHNYID